MSQADFAPYLECSISMAVDLVNSFDPVDGTDLLARPADLAAFLAEQEVSHVRRGPSREDLERVKELRSRLRDVFVATDQARAGSILNQILAETGARPELTNHDGQPWHMHYSPEGTPIAPRLAAESAMALSVVIIEGGFNRLRVCEAETCVDVFVDASRNSSRRYCSPQVCGNRASVAAFRARRKAALAAKAAAAPSDE